MIGEIYSKKSFRTYEYKSEKLLLEEFLFLVDDDK
jgi:hypothetical protein